MLAFEGSGDKRALLSKMDVGVCVLVRMRSHIEWNSFVLSLNDDDDILFLFE